MISEVYDVRTIGSLSSHELRQSLYAAGLRCVSIHVSVTLLEDNGRKAEEMETLTVWQVR